MSDPTKPARDAGAQADKQLDRYILARVGRVDTHGEAKLAITACMIAAAEYGALAHAMVISHRITEEEVEAISNGLRERREGAEL